MFTELWQFIFLAGVTSMFIALLALYIVRQRCQVAEISAAQLERGEKFGQSPRNKCARFFQILFFLTFSPERHLYSNL
jgi:hypothetical protein